MITTHTLALADGCLRYRVCGKGPVLLLLGAPPEAEGWGPLTDALASDFTVVTHESRLIADAAARRCSRPPSIPDLAASDAAMLLTVLGAGSTDVFGTRAGAITGLALVERYPGWVRTLVAHEPPLPPSPPGSAALRSTIEDIVETLHQHGVPAAWQKFLSRPELHEDGGPPVPYLPDAALLTSGATRVVVGVGAESIGPPVHSAGTLAGLLGTPAVEFPGDHGGFLQRPEEFADVLRTVLLDQPPRNAPDIN